MGKTMGASTLCVDEGNVGVEPCPFEPFVLTVAMLVKDSAHTCEVYASQLIDLLLLQDIVQSMYKCVMARLMAQDQDQEVKDCAISCMAAAVSQLGDAIQPQLPQVLQVGHTCCAYQQQLML